MLFTSDLEYRKWYYSLSQKDRKREDKRNWIIQQEANATKIANDTGYIILFSSAAIFIGFSMDINWLFWSSTGLIILSVIICLWMMPDEN